MSQKKVGGQGRKRSGLFPRSQAGVVSPQTKLERKKARESSKRVHPAGKLFTGPVTVSTSGEGGCE